MSRKYEISSTKPWKKIGNNDENWKKNPEKKFFFFAIFFSKSRNGEDFHEISAETKSRNSGDHEFWNHEMWGPPVNFLVNFLRAHLQKQYLLITFY